MPRYKEIFETLKAEIRIGKFGACGSFPSERALMRRFSVARETIRHAIEELRKQNLIEARQGTMNVLAFRARERATGTFGVIVPDAYYPFYSRISAGIEHFAKRTKEGSFTLLSADLGSGGCPSQASRALEFAEVCIREKVCGEFFQPLQLAKESERINKAILSLLLTRPTSPLFFLIATSFRRRAGASTILSALTTLPSVTSLGGMSSGAGQSA